jgi:hypothetical protein
LPWLSALTENKGRFQRAMALLQEYSLVEASASGYSLHNYVHDWTLQTLNRDLSEEYFWMAVHCIALRTHVSPQKNTWQVNRSFVEYSIRVEHKRFSVFLEGDILGDGRLSNLHNLGVLFASQGDHSRAEHLYEMVLAQKEKELEQTICRFLQ